MSTYLKYYALERSPFDGEAQSKVVLGTKALRDALDTVRAGIKEGASRICVNGGSGMGKTSLASALPKLLEDDVRVAVILHPGEDWNAHRRSLAKQWRLGEGGLSRASLLEASTESRLVLVIDEAETASEDFLDHLDVLLSYRSPEDQPIAQSVLFANLELVRKSGQAKPAEASPLLWWLDRIQTLQLEFAPLPRDGVDTYIQKHLKRAGWRGERIFSPDACYAIHEYSGGIPREVGRYAEELLVEASTRDLKSIEDELVHEILEHAAKASSDSPSDEFEELVSEEEFLGADQSDEAMPTSGEPVSGEPLKRALEHFSSTESDDVYSGPAYQNSNDSDESAATFCETVRATEGETMAAEGRPISSDGSGGALADFHAYLSSPASDDELRALKGPLMSPTLRMAAAIALAIGLGALLLTWLRPAPSNESQAGLVPEAVLEEVVIQQSRADAPLADSPQSPEEAASDPQKPAVLAQIKGPITDEQTQTTSDTPPETPKNLPEGNQPSDSPDPVSEPVPAAPGAHP